MSKVVQVQDFYDYYITNTGSVYSRNYRQTGRFKKLKTEQIKGGYLRIGLCKNGSITKFLVHRLVAEAFIPNPENKREVNHKNGNKKDNDVKNLEWCTRSENQLHRFAVLGQNGGAYGKTGKKCPRSKIVLQIYKGEIIGVFYGAREASKATGINHSNISGCCKHRYGYKSAGGFQWEYKK